MSIKSLSEVLKRFCKKFISIKGKVVSVLPFISIYRNGKIIDRVMSSEKLFRLDNKIKKKNLFFIPLSEIL